MNRREFLAAGALTLATFGLPLTPVEAGEKMATIEGSFGWRERMLPRPGTLATVTLDDISRADAASVTLASVKIDMTGKSVPRKFALKVPADKLKKNMTYSVRVRVTDRKGKLLYITDTVNPVDPAKGSQNVGNLMLKKTG